MSKKLFVGSLPYEVDQENLKKVFEEFGEVTSAQVIMDRETGRSRGFGFVEMASAEEADAAIKGLDGKNVQGRTIVVSEAKENPKKKAPRRSY